MPEIRADLSRHPVKTRVSLTGTMVVARDIAHAKLQERLDRGEGLPDYLKNHPVYYAGPAKTPAGLRHRLVRPDHGRPHGQLCGCTCRQPAARWSCWPRATASRAVRDACQAHGGFYLGSVGGPAARLAQDCIRKVEVLEYPELGMEAVWRIEVEDFPAFIVMDDKGNDFFAEIGG